MSEWVQPRQRVLHCCEPSAIGRGLGIINRKYFDPGTWEPLLSSEMGRGQYSRFVASIVERIRVKESSYDEIRSFVHLVASERSWDFMKLAMPFLPELEEQYPHDTKNFEIALLFLLKPKIRRRSIKETQNAIPASRTYENGLSKTEEQLLRRQLFGPNRGALDSPGMSRLFKSTLELGYPQQALDQSMREAKERGTDIERCSEGLPRNMLMPKANTRPDKISLSTQNLGAATLGVWIPSTSADLSRVPSSSTVESDELSDSPPYELLTELAVDGDPLLIHPNKIETSYGERLKLKEIEDIDQAGCPDRPQMPCNEPSRIQHGPAVREVFDAYDKQPVSVSLDYFHGLERGLNPPMTEPGSKWSDWPYSPSKPSHSLLAAAPKPPQTDTSPGAISKLEQATEMPVCVTDIVEASRLSKPCNNVRAQGCGTNGLINDEMNFTGHIPPHSVFD